MSEHDDNDLEQSSTSDLSLSTIISTNRSVDLKSTFFKKSHKLVFSQLSLSPVMHDIVALFLTRLHADHWKPFMNGEQIHSPTYSFSNAVLTDWFGIPTSKHYSTLMQPAERLSNKSIGIKDNESKKFSFTPLFKKITYENGQLYITPNDLLMNEYLALSGGHSQVPHRNFRDIKKEHAKRLYTMLCRYRNEKFSVFHPQSIAELHAYFGLLDKSGNLVTKSYAATGKFIQKVIKPSIKEIDETEPNLVFLIDEKTGNLGYETIKNGRTIVEIRFLFEWNNSKQIDQDERDKREELANQINPLDLAKLTYEMVNSFIPGDDGNPTVEELNNMMAMAAQLMTNGLVLDAKFMGKFALSMQEARNKQPPDDVKQNKEPIDA